MEEQTAALAGVRVLDLRQFEAAPLLGEHAETVLRHWSDLTANDIAKLNSEGAI